MTQTAPVPLGAYPNHLTQEKCVELHAIYRDAVNVSSLNVEIGELRMVTTTLSVPCVVHEHGRKVGNWERREGRAPRGRAVHPNLGKEQSLTIKYLCTV